MNTKNYCILLLLILLLTFIPQTNADMDEHHTVFALVSSSGSCGPCESWTEHLHSAHLNDTGRFTFLELIGFDETGRIINQKAIDWGGLQSYPYTSFDGGYTRINKDNIAQLNGAINVSLHRNIPAINATLNAELIGTAKLHITGTIINDQNSTYHGYARISVAELISRYVGLNGTHFHHGFLDYIQLNLSLQPYGEYSFEEYWNGQYVYDAEGNNFSDVTQENLLVIMPIYNNQSGYADETATSLVSLGTTTNLAPEPQMRTPVVGYLNKEISLSADKSIDRDGIINSYSWDMGDGTTYTQSSIKHTYTNTGNYTITLTTTDDEGTSNSTTKTLEVIATNIAPTLTQFFGAINCEANTPYTYYFNSTDPESDYVSYHIDWDDTSTTTIDAVSSSILFSISHSWTQADRYTLTLTVTDAGGETAIGQRYIYVDSILLQNLGYLTDDDNDDIYDTYHHLDGTQTSDVQVQENGTLLLDTDFDNQYDRMYSPETQEISAYTPPFPVLWILLIAVALAIAVGILLVRKKRK